MTVRIATTFWAKPIPIRQFDWSAWYDGDEPNDDGQMKMGYGRTKDEAVALWIGFKTVEQRDEAMKIFRASDGETVGEKK